MSDFSWKAKFLAITPKPFAMLSIMGSLYIIKHVLTSPKRFGKVYHRILLGLSIYDLMTSCAVFMGTWPIPKGTDGVYMASGNERTCSAQGFWIQLGVGTPLYNASLALYYFLVVFKGWQERQLKKAEPFLHLFPIVFSLSTAIGAAITDSYRSSNVWCWITSSNSGFRFGFFYGPVWAAMATVTVAMVAIYGHVLNQERKTKRYQNPESTTFSESVSDPPARRRQSVSSKRQSSSRKIASQAMFYVGSFYLTFVFPSWTRISQMVNGSSPFAVIALFAIFFPLQGFFNSMVYFRPRYLRYRREHPEVGFFRVIGKGMASIAIFKSIYQNTGQESAGSNPIRST